MFIFPDKLGDRLFRQFYFLLSPRLTRFLVFLCVVPVQIVCDAVKNLIYLQRLGHLRRSFQTPLRFIKFSPFFFLSF